MRIDIITLFPEVFEPFLSTSIVGRARHAGILQCVLWQLRDFSTDRHRKVDDRPYGGGPGMVLMCQPVFDAVEFVESRAQPPPTRILLTPQGVPFNQHLARELAIAPRLLILCGHYEGFDERIREGIQWREISVGDYVLSGGEAAAMVLIDAVVRLLPGALGEPASLTEESFSDGLLEYPQYTRPPEFRGMRVPDVLLSGNHGLIARWRAEQRRRRTQQRRADLLPPPEPPAPPPGPPDSGPAGP